MARPYVTGIIEDWIFPEASKLWTSALALFGDV
jgi:hypothetical protein